MSCPSRKSFLSVEETISIPRLSAPAVTNDGRRVAWVRTEPDWEKNQFRRYVFVHDTGTSSFYSVTADGCLPSWSSQGQLAWLEPVEQDSDRANQIFIWHEGRPLQITRVASGVNTFKWGPDDQTILYLAPDPEMDNDIRKRNHLYGTFEYVDVDYRPSCLYRLEVSRAREKALCRNLRPKDLASERHCPEPSIRLAGGPGVHIHSFDLSPDGSRVVFMSAPSPNPEDEARAEVHLMDLETGKVSLIPTGKPVDIYQGIHFSPCGTRICYNRPLDGEKVIGVSTLEVWDLEKGTATRPLTSLDETIFPVRWTEKGLVFIWQERTSWHVSRLEGNGKIASLKEEANTVTLHAAVSADGQHLARITASIDSPYELYLNHERITDQRSHYSAHILARREVVSWKSLDGTDIEGVLITPREMYPDRSYPLLVLVHGGPSWAALPVPNGESCGPAEPFVEKGFILLDVNYRGSSGYGHAFRQLNYRNLGLGDYDDVISGVNMLVEKGLADPDRVGVMGWSQGGYIAAMCATYGDGFAAASVGAGISNWYTYYCNTDIHPFTRRYLGETPWSDPEVYSRTSPMTYIKQAKTPALIQHGDGDTRVPLPNAMELYQGLRDMKVNVRLVVFKGMGHSPEKPGLCRAIIRQNFNWFCHHLLGEPLEGFWLRTGHSDADTP